MAVFNIPVDLPGGVLALYFSVYRRVEAMMTLLCGNLGIQNEDYSFLLCHPGHYHLLQRAAVSDHRGQTASLVDLQAVGSLDLGLLEEKQQK